MDKTLKEYIERTKEKIDEYNKVPLTPNPNQYLIYPENKPDEEKSTNPYGQH